MAPTIASHVAPGGLLSLSGILSHQAEEVRQAYQNAGFVLDEPVDREGWVRLDGRKVGVS